MFFASHVLKYWLMQYAILNFRDLMRARIKGFFFLISEAKKVTRRFYGKQNSNITQPQIQTVFIELLNCNKKCKHNLTWSSCGFILYFLAYINLHTQPDDCRLRMKHVAFYYITQLYVHLCCCVEGTFCCCCCSCCC
jgi:hypothetical protein